jgi:hypothetical protein
VARSGWATVAVGGQLGSQLGYLDDSTHENRATAIPNEPEPVVTVQFTRQHVVAVLRKAGFRRQLTRPCASCPTQLILITPRDGPRRTVLPRVNSSAGWAAARDAVSGAAPQPLQRTVQRPGCGRLSSSSWGISSRRPLGRVQLVIRPRSRALAVARSAPAPTALPSHDWPPALSSGGYDRGPPGVTIAGMQPPTATTWQARRWTRTSGGPA